MNPLIKKWIGSAVRAVLLLSVGGYLKDKGIWSEAEAEEYITAFALVAVPTIWSLYEKWQAQRTQNTTLAVMNAISGPSVANVAAQDIQTVIKKGDAAPALTPVNLPPVLKGTGDGVAHLLHVTGR